MFLIFARDVGEHLADEGVVGCFDLRDDTLAGGRKGRERKPIILGVGSSLHKSAGLELFHQAGDEGIIELELPLQRRMARLFLCKQRKQRVA